MAKRRLAIFVATLCVVVWTLSFLVGDARAQQPACAAGSAILLGAVVLGESLAARDFVGLGLIALGLAVIDGRLPQAARARLAAAGRR